MKRILVLLLVLLLSSTTVFAEVVTPEPDVDFTFDVFESDLAELTSDTVGQYFIDNCPAIASLLRQEVPALDAERWISVSDVFIYPLLPDGSAVICLICENDLISSIGITYQESTASKAANRAFSFFTDLGSSDMSDTAAFFNADGMCDFAFIFPGLLGDSPSYAKAVFLGDHWNLLAVYQPETPNLFMVLINQAD